MCDGVHVVEREPVHLIRRDKVPVVRSTMNSNGEVATRVEKMAKDVDYVAISHVWVGGLGNFVKNQLTQCQVQAIHQDVYQATISAFNNILQDMEDMPISERFLRPQQAGHSGWLSSLRTSTTLLLLDGYALHTKRPSQRKEGRNQFNGKNLRWNGRRASPRSGIEKR
jgi:hypothetical protein